MRRLSLTLLMAWLLLLCSVPSRADQLMAEADLAVCKSLNTLGLQLQQAGSIMEKWVSGRTPSEEVQKDLNALLLAFKTEESHLARLKVPAGAQPLLQGALRCAAQRRKALGEALTLSQQGKLSGSILRSYWKATLETTRLSQRDWFRTRLGFVALALKGKNSRAVVEFYSWQASILRAWMEESEISAQAQLLLSQEYQSEQERRQLEQGAIDLMNKAIVVHKSSELVRTSGTVGRAQRAALEEQLSLIRLAEYLSFLYQDPSQDSVDRLRRGIRDLSECSVKLEKGSLEALEEACKKKS